METEGNGENVVDGHKRPGARNFFLVSYAGAGSQGFGPSSIVFPGHQQELDGK